MTTEDEDLDELWDVLRPPPPETELYRRRVLQMVNSAVEKAKKACQNCEGPGTEDGHVCPHAEEIYGDAENLCNCCEECTQGCANDI